MALLRGASSHRWAMRAPPAACVPTAVCCPAHLMAPCECCAHFRAARIAGLAVVLAHGPGCCCCAACAGLQQGVWGCVQCAVCRLCRAWGVVRGGGAHGTWRAAPSVTACMRLLCRPMACGALCAACMCCCSGAPKVACGQHRAMRARMHAASVRAQVVPAAGACRPGASKRLIAAEGFCRPVRARMRKSPRTRRTHPYTNAAPACLHQSNWCCACSSWWR